MTRLIHVLGADIPHHNQTILRFFDQQLAGDLNLPAALTEQFMVVAADNASFAAFSRLNIDIYPDKRALARAVAARAAAEPTARFFLHGQFNPQVWLALWLNTLPNQRVSWHIWGGDLYEEARSWKHRLFYLLRRRAQDRVGHVFATHGDLSVYRARFSGVPTSTLYFPTRMDPALDNGPVEPRDPESFTVLLGNSGDPSNHHLEALERIARQFGADARVIVPLGYPANNEAYIAKIRAEGEKYFPPGNVELLTEPVAFDAYLALLRRCDLGYFPFDRQQGIGTLCLLIQCNVPFVLSAANPFHLDLLAAKVPVLFKDKKLDRFDARKAQRELAALDKSGIAFFYPNYLPGWRQALDVALGAAS